MNVSCVVRTYNEGKHLGNLLSALKKQSVGDIDIIIIDSGSNDNTVNIAKKNNCRIKRIKKEDFTFGKSLNIGCKEAKNELIVICSAHVLPINNYWIEELIKPLEKKNCAMSYGLQRGVESSYFSEKQIFQDYFPDTGENNIENFANNANSAIKKSVWEKVHFNEKITGLEDIEYSKKISNLGFKTEYVPKAGIYHIHEETPMQIKWRFEREAIALKVIYNKINPRYVNILKFLIDNICSDIKALFKSSEFNINNLCSIFTYRFFQSYGIFCSKSDDPITPHKFKMFYYPSKK